LLAEEVESYKSQIKSLKLEMEEQVGGFYGPFFTSFNEKDLN
jgi:hypothetical protein